MKWSSLFSKTRLGREGRESSTLTRTEFQRDQDRIVFSSAFRRLQNKTQVVPLPDSDYVRNRLTHSMETASVGRSLATVVGSALIKENTDLFHELDIHESDFGAVVSAACLAHDLGNPPFGHSGEDAISAYFRDGRGQSYLEHCSSAQIADLQNFEGNASGFRLLTANLEGQTELEGGLGLTYSTLATFSKYPKQSIPNLKKDGRASGKKYGFFQTEKEIFKKVANRLQLKEKEHSYSWCRHPLSFLLEASDDICYHIIDFEDGYNLGIINFDLIESLYIQLLGKDWLNIEARYKRVLSEQSKISYLRSLVINKLIRSCSAVFLENETAILDASFDKPLIDQTEEIDLLNQIINHSIEKCYKHRNVLEIEAAGFEIMSGLLDAFAPAVLEPKNLRSKKIMQLYPKQFLSRDSKVYDDTYLNLINIVMFVSSMTDNYAIKLFRKIKGVSI